ncbi:MAG TPA: YifB family Mg chelatase-like AAA ATPase [Thermomicrobiales bacterium]|nr:YifB family Mg chelatase-like AAA ATPase [Thermomicrobiales bacterium]
MLAKVLSCATVGLDGALVEVEVFANSPAGQPGIVVVGLPDAAVQESKERVRAAIRSSGGRVPLGRIIVNLAPADLRKEGPAYDLPIAVGLLIAGGSLRADLDDAVVLGELSLDGGVRHTTGVLPMVALSARAGLRRAFVPFDDADEAALVDGIDIYPVDTLSGLMKHLDGSVPIPPYVGKRDDEMTFESLATDFSVIRGQEQVKRGLEVAAAGGHNVLMTGPPGTGKTLLARALPSILPPLARDDAIEVSKIYSVAGMLPSGQPLIRERPFRSPHHTVSYAGLVGGGRFPRPGEISMAHRGVLFLDELPEFGQNVLEVLRQPLEDRIVTISRASGSITYPANFILVAAMNPCPCGYAGDPVRECTCSSSAIQRYQKRISGPLLDRIDIHLDVPRIEYEKLSDSRAGEPSAAIRSRVEAAREVQSRRLVGTTLRTNADMGAKEVQQHCFLDNASETLMRSAMRQLQLSARSYHRILKLARTISDLAGEETIRSHHLAEALQYRPKVIS